MQTLHWFLSRRADQFLAALNWRIKTLGIWISIVSSAKSRQRQSMYGTSSKLIFCCLPSFLDSKRDQSHPKVKLWGPSLCGLVVVGGAGRINETEGSKAIQTIKIILSTYLPSHHDTRSFLISWISQEQDDKFNDKIGNVPFFKSKNAQPLAMNSHNKSGVKSSKSIWFCFSSL